MALVQPKTIGIQLRADPEAMTATRKTNLKTSSLPCIDRRNFLQGALFGALTVGLSPVVKKAKYPFAPDARVDVLLDEVIGRINPGIYGHFAEHLGGVVYDGIWVGENSKVPNLRLVRSSHGCAIGAGGLQCAAS